MDEIVKSSKNIPTGSKRIKSSINKEILILKAVTLLSIAEGAKLKVINSKGVKILPLDFFNEYILHKTGLEIGGPSQVFSSSGVIPLYQFASSLDNVNYSDVTLWDNKDKSKPEIFRKIIINEASNLTDIESESYDFVASSNVIEHLSNPLLSLLEMKRVICSGGMIITIAPHKDITFDHRRPVTRIKSLIEIFELHPIEGDISHLDLKEIFKDYDLELDLPAGNLDAFKKRTQDNRLNRALYQTVFNTQLLLEMFNWAEIKICYVKTSLNLGHILVIGEKSPDSKDEISKSNLRFLSPNAVWRNSTIFRSERI
jgi:SAM-dependent methyltransferase